jgi:hypothetical protein
MANPNNPFGFRPVIRAGGAPFSINQYAKAAADANAIFAFDLVTKVATAVANPEQPLYNLPGVQTGYQATPGTSLWLGASLAYGAAATLSIHPVTDEIDVVYIAQAKTGVVISTATHAGLNANVSQTLAGLTTTKMSRLAVDSATLAVTATLDLRVQRVAMILPNVDGDSAILEVTINKHQMGQNTLGI